MSRRRARPTSHDDALAHRADHCADDGGDPHAAALLRRARRLARDRDYRKAALALRELTARCPDARAYALLGDMLRRARRDEEAVAAFKEAMWLQRQAGAQGRVRTLARLILAIDPADAKVARLAA
jgi:tetratricopeptide (TPR) repeat protein